MKHYIILLLILFCCLCKNTLYAQTVLNPADSLEVAPNWYKEYPVSFNFHTSFIFNSAFNLRYDNFYNFLDGQGFTPDKFFSTYSTGLGIRFSKTFIRGNVSFSIGSDGESHMANRSEIVSWAQSQRQFDISIGQVVFDKPFATFILKGGVGLSRFDFNYYSYDAEATFDFDEPSSSAVSSFPRFQHQNGFWNIEIEFLRGFKEYKKFTFSPSLRIGYLRGFNDNNWDAIGVNEVNALNDRVEQFYIAGDLNIFRNKPKK